MSVPAVIERINKLQESGVITGYKVQVDYGKLGMDISICKRKSFHKFSDILNPYYSRKELIKLGQNIGIIKNFILLC